MAGFLNNIELNLEIVLKNKADSSEVSETLVTRICENLLLSKEVSFLSKKKKKKDSIKHNVISSKRRMKVLF